MQQFETLLTDLHDNFANGQPSFLGTVCLSEESTRDAISIVDGQQRITTLGILLHILNEKLGISGDVVPPAFIKKKKLTEMPKGPLKPGIPYMRIADLLKSSACCSEEFRNYLLNKVCFSVLWVPAAMQYKIFDSVNSTGKALEIQELVYNTLYERTDEDQRKTLTGNWNQFLGLMAGIEEAGASQEFSRDDALDQNQDDPSVSDAPEADENASNQTKGKNSRDSQGKQLNFRHFLLPSCGATAPKGIAATFTVPLSSTWKTFPRKAIRTAARWPGTSWMPRGTTPCSSRPWTNWIRSGSRTVFRR